MKIYKLKVRKIPKQFYLKLEQETPESVIGIETDKYGNVLPSNGYSESIHIIQKKAIKKMTECLI